jgi:hypothetical protein
VVLQEWVEGVSAGECKSRQSCPERARLVLVLVLAGEESKDLKQ